MSSMYFVCPRPCRRPSARVARWPTAGVCWRASGTTTSTGRSPAAQAPAAAESPVFPAISGLSATFDVRLPSFWLLTLAVTRLGYFTAGLFAAHDARRRPESLRSSWCSRCTGTDCRPAHRESPASVGSGFSSSSALADMMHARPAESALQRTVILECFLQRMQVVGVGQAFDRRARRGHPPGPPASGRSSPACRRRSPCTRRNRRRRSRVWRRSD